MIDDLKKAADVASTAAKALEGTEGGKLAKDELGKTALTVTKLVNNALLPIAAVNFAFDKAREYFGTKFPQDMHERVKDVPPEELTAPKASIAGQALQGLAYSHDEPDLKELYLALLGKAMTKSSAPSIHPSFVEIIRQLAAEEIELLSKVLRAPSNLPIVEIHVEKGGGNVTLEKHVIDLRNVPGDTPAETPRIAVFIENWKRLGLVEVHYDRWLVPADQYRRFEERPEFLRAKAERETAASKVGIDKGVLERTQFGRDFAKAVGMLDIEAQPTLTKDT